MNSPKVTITRFSPTISLSPALSIDGRAIANAFVQSNTLMDILFEGFQARAAARVVVKP